MTKALILFSWGLDSILTVKLLEEQWIECTAITFFTPFFWKEKAEISAKKYWINLITKDISEEHLKIVRNPKYWYWKNMNPCIDCHWFMIQKACEFADEMKFDIVATWEVLWQRPMSQTTRWMNAVNKVSGKEVLRPLSAKLLPETEYEKKWLVDRSKLLDITWRWRQKQLKLAKQFWIEWFEMPWWWCLLTQEWYSEKIKSLFKSFSDKILSIDTEIIKYWRLKTFSRWYVVLWRDDEDNKKIFSIKPNRDEYMLAHIKETTWPIALIKIICEWYNEKDVTDFYREKVQKLNNIEKFTLIYE